MNSGVSSFNHFIHELSVDSDTSSSIDYSSGDEDTDDMCPASPLSQSSRVSRARSFRKHNGLLAHWIRCIFAWLLFPAKSLLRLPFYLYHAFCYRGSRTLNTTGSPQPLYLHSTKRAHTLKDHVVQCATDRRRGVIEDLHLAIEIFIEAVFDVVHKAAHCLLSPSDTLRKLSRWLVCPRSNVNDIPACGSDASVSTATLAENDPIPRERKTTFHHSLNTDARTCRDVITELGYPYEAIHVTTADGYVLLVERIPRRDSRKVVYLQHGILDSSMGCRRIGNVGKKDHGNVLGDDVKDLRIGVLISYVEMSKDICDVMGAIFSTLGEDKCQF
ncbi:unnamed protein product [Ilex paraguariensis]|uniref:Partial AB-hydrolase lipase domain-containing protein n=1 Tax=Ilex paraguariensis TaxID=185542 RepID=A0ABC8UZV2_9AQUA